jgi:hypothetical protein
MSTQEGAGAGANPGAGAASADAGANPGGTPNPGAADATTKGGKTYDETAFKGVVQERDAAKQAARELQAQIAALTEKVGAFEQSKKAAEEAALAEQGKFKELYEKERAARETAERTAAEAASSARTRVAKTQIESAFKGLGGVDAEWLDFKASKAIEKGDLKIGNDGAVAGLEVFLDGLRKAHPAQFGAAAATGGGGTVPGGTGAAPPSDPKKLLQGRRGNLGDGPVLKPDERRALNEMWPKK